MAPIGASPQAVLQLLRLWLVVPVLQKAVKPGLAKLGP